MRSRLSLVQYYQVTNPRGCYPLIPYLAASALMAIYLVLALHFQFLAGFLQN